MEDMLVSGVLCFIISIFQDFKNAGNFRFMREVRYNKRSRSTKSREHLTDRAQAQDSVTTIQIYFVSDSLASLRVSSLRLTVKR